MSDQRLSILGVSFDVTSLSEVLERLNQACDEKGQVFCVTPNPEICLAAQEDRAFLKILNGADLSIADGFGILWAARYLQSKRGFFRWLWTLLTPGQTKRHSPFPERVTGTDVVQHFCQQFPERKVFLLGAAPDVNEQLKDQLKNAQVKVVGNYSGDASEKLEPIIRSMIIASDAEVLFVAFGAPHQEQWITRNLPQLPGVKVAMGIGGAFDFMTGKRKRAPRWMRSIGLEWLYRLLIEPKRIKRIFRATVVFPWKVFRYEQK